MPAGLLAPHIQDSVGLSRPGVVAIPLSLHSYLPNACREMRSVPKLRHNIRCLIVYRSRVKRMWSKVMLPEPLIKVLLMHAAVVS